MPPWQPICTSDWLSTVKSGAELRPWRGGVRPCFFLGSLWPRLQVGSYSEAMEEYMS